MIHPLTPPEVTPQVIAVKVPQNATDWMLSTVLSGVLNFYDNEGNVISRVTIGPGFELIGNYGSATEEMAKRIVEKFEWHSPEKITLYRDYSKPDKNSETWNIGFSTALESLHSLMNSKKLFLVNPYGEKEPDILKYGNDPKEMARYKRDVEQWQEAEKNKSDYVFLINPTPAINI